MPKLYSLSVIYEVVVHAAWASTSTSSTGSRLRLIKQWYLENIPIADERYDKYLAEQGLLRER